MSIWTDIVSNRSLLLGPMFSAAVVSSFISWLVGRANRKAASADVAQKIAAERTTTEQKIESENELLMKKLAHENAAKLTDRAWSDYSIRRDIYLDLISKIDYLFKTSEDPKERLEFLRSAQKVRLIGSDEVVASLNALTASIKDGEPSETRAARYSGLMNSIRVDIRRLNELPAVGTKLNNSAFPIEI